MSIGPGVILGSYELVELLARGGMGEVYRARHRRLTDREVAIKVMPAVLAADPTFLQRFEREANNIAALNHPHILPLWDYGEQAGLPYIVMPLVRGGSLRERIRGRRMFPAEVLHYVRPIAEALDYAHARGIVHRDIKPANILLDDRGHIYVADFGIAKATEGSVEGLTRTGVGIGTPEYMAPEQAQGQADPRSDIYALGIIAYEGLTGRVPYTGKTPVDVAIKHATVPLPPLDDLGNVVNPALEAVVRKALAKAPDDRYASAGAFVNDFVSSLGGADSPTTNLSTADGPTHASLPGVEAPRTGFLPPPAAGQPGQPVTATPARPIWRVVAITLAIGLVLGLGLAVGGVLLLNSRGGTQVVGRGASEATATVASGASASDAPDTPGASPRATTAATGPSPVATSGAIPYPFPIDNAIIASTYAEALGRVPAEARADAKLNAVFITCFDPRADADCALAYRFYSRQTDTQYGYSFSRFDTRPVEELIEPATDNSNRITFVKLPWEQNPNWSSLLAESYAQLPAGFGEQGFEIEMSSQAESLNQGTYDWFGQYMDKATSEYFYFYIRGTRVTKNT